jgi:hypothetical protein
MELKKCCWLLSGDLYECRDALIILANLAGLLIPYGEKQGSL